jgi:DNA-binding CsgD family transcriptional regulator
VDTTGNFAVIVIEGRLAGLGGAPEDSPRGFVLPSSPASLLIDALHSIAAGRDYVDPALAALQPGIGEPSPVRHLSPREHEILGLLSEGLTGQAIARRLFLSPETVRTHVRNATAKLGAKTRVQAVALLVGSRSPRGAAAPVPALVRRPPRADPSAARHATSRRGCARTAS